MARHTGIVGIPDYSEVRVKGARRNDTELLMGCMYGTNDFQCLGEVVEDGINSPNPILKLSHYSLKKLGNMLHGNKWVYANTFLVGQTTEMSYTFSLYESILLQKSQDHYDFHMASTRIDSAGLESRIMVSFEKHLCRKHYKKTTSTLVEYDGRVIKLQDLTILAQFSRDHLQCTVFGVEGTLIYFLIKFVTDSVYREKVENVLKKYNVQFEVYSEEMANLRFVGKAVDNADEFNKPIDEIFELVLNPESRDDVSISNNVHNLRFKVKSVNHGNLATCIFENDSKLHSHIFYSTMIPYSLESIKRPDYKEAETNYQTLYRAPRTDITSGILQISDRDVYNVVPRVEQDKTPFYLYMYLDEKSMGDSLKNAIRTIIGRLRHMGDHSRLLLDCSTETGRNVYTMQPDMYYNTECVNELMSLLDDIEYRYRHEYSTNSCLPSGMIINANVNIFIENRSQLDTLLSLCSLLGINKRVEVKILVPENVGDEERIISALTK